LEYLSKNADNLIYAESAYLKVLAKPARQHHRTYSESFK
jgi:hypothetical protein